MSSTFRYPIPVHDTLAGFDWLLRNLKPSRLTVFGSHIGGSLALMLALTEAQSLKAVAALDPICDWVGLDDYCTVSIVGQSDGSSSNSEKSVTPGRKSKTVPGDLLHLLEMRRKLFRGPSGYFDAFASPVLFLRAAGRETPKTFPEYLTGPEYPVPVLELPLEAEGEEQAALLDSYALPEGDEEGDQREEEEEERGEDDKRVVHRRKALLRWPPYGLDYGLGKTHNSSRLGIGRLQMTLPSTRVYVRDDKLQQQVSSPSSSRSKGRTVLARQAVELVSIMRRACFWGQGMGVAENRVRLVPVDPMVSSTSVERDAGEWLNEIMSRDD